MAGKLCPNRATYSGPEMPAYPASPNAGFHSQAGWHCFNQLALGFTVSARRLRWFSLSAEEVSVEQSSVNPAALLLTAVP